MNVVITPSRLHGRIDAPASKSAAHRALITHALGRKRSTLKLSCDSEDLQATRRCLEALGARFETHGDRLYVTPIENVPRDAVLDCGESGSTLRFLMPIAAALGVHARFVCHGRLAKRPLKDLQEALSAHGVIFLSAHEICGQLMPGDYRLDGDVSSQYVTGLLFALALLAGESTITLTTPLQSVGYVEMTLQAIKSAQVAITRGENSFHIQGGARFDPPQTAMVEGDYSNAAFFLGAGVEVGNLSPESAQGDRAILDILKAMGAHIQVKQNAHLAMHQNLCPIDLDVSQIPDLVPPVAVLCAASAGESHITNAARLRLKESDRIQSVCAMLTSLGVPVEEHPDAITVYGGTIHGGVVDSFHDHRIAMAAALASHFASGEITVLGAECVNKSYPHFWDDFRAMGGRFTIQP